MEQRRERKSQDDRRKYVNGIGCLDSVCGDELHVGPANRDWSGWRWKCNEGACCTCSNLRRIGRRGSILAWPVAAPATLALALQSSAEVGGPTRAERAKVNLCRS